MTSSETKPCTIDSGKCDDVNSDFFNFIARTHPHIVEQIFDSLDLNDLLNCRLVCHQWLLFAQKPLQTQIRMLFVHGVEFVGSSPKHLKELNTLMTNGQAIRDFGDGERIPYVFPCNRFEFQPVDLNNEDLQQFLNTNGKNIRELTFLSYLKEMNENLLIDQIANLLLNQAPNIQKLHLDIDAQVHWEIESGEGNIRSKDSRLQPTDPEYEGICQKASDLLKSKTTSSSLKVLKLWGNGFAKILEFIIHISPNLEEVILSESDQKYLLVPENRSHLIKSISFESVYNVEFVKQMEIISPKARLRKIELNLHNVSLWIQKNSDSDSEQRVVNLINSLLEGSWNTLEQICFDKVTLLRGIKLPVLPKVREIEFVSYSDATGFPMGFDFQNIFPNLRCIHIKNYAYFDKQLIFPGFLNFVNFGTDCHNLLSTSVRRVLLFPGWFRDDDEGGLRSAAPSILQRVERWFPNANYFVKA